MEEKFVFFSLSSTNRSLSTSEIRVQFVSTQLDVCCTAEVELLLLLYVSSVYPRSFGRCLFSLLRDFDFLFIDNREQRVKEID